MKKTIIFVIPVALIAIPLTSCNLSKNINTASSASYQKLQIIQQVDIKKQNETITTSNISVLGISEKADTPIPEKNTGKSIAVNSHKSLIKNILAIPFAPGFKLVAMGKERIHTAHSKVENTRLTVRHALRSMLVGLGLAIIGGVIILLVDPIVQVGGYESPLLILEVLGGIALFVGYIMFWVSFILLIIALIKRLIIGYD